MESIPCKVWRELNWTRQFLASNFWPIDFRVRYVLAKYQALAINLGVVNVPVFGANRKFHYRTRWIPSFLQTCFTECGMIHRAIRFIPNSILDIGANHGQWSYPWMLLRNTIELVAYEPAIPIADECRANLKSFPNATVHYVGLCNGPTCQHNSVLYGYPQNTSSLELSTIQINGKVPKLNSIFRDPKINANFEMVKIDTEGGEDYILECLRFSRTLPRVVVIEINEGNSLNNVLKILHTKTGDDWRVAIAPSPEYGNAVLTR